MSLESVAIALHHSRATGSTKLVLIGIANHDGDGGAWPSVATLARYSGVSPRNVQKAIGRLEQLHEIRRHIQAGGVAATADYKRPNRYEFLLSCPPSCDRTRHHRDRNFAPVMLDIEGDTEGTSLATGGVAGDTEGTSLATPEPPLNTSTKTEKSTYVRRRARARSAACGHELVDDRHCTHGCRQAHQDTHTQARAS